MAFDLTRSRFFGPLIKNPLWQGTIRWFSLAALVALLVVAWGRTTLPGIADSWPLIYTNATTLIFWVLWFMGLVISVPFVGRLWCSICPLGFVTEKLGKIGLNVKWPAPPFNWLGAISIFLVGLGGALYWNVHKNPASTAIFVGLALLLAVFSGLVWRRASFCGLFCPIGLVLSIYSRFSPIYVAAKDAGKCASCDDKACTARKSRWKRWDLGPSLVIQKQMWEGGCPAALTPRSMDRSACQLCMECVRNCSRSNMAVYYGGKNSNRPFSTPALVLFVFLTGLVTLALSRTWPALRDALIPGIHPPAWVSALWLGAAVPALFIFAAPLLTHFGEKFSGKESSGPSDGSAPPRLEEGEKPLTLWERAKIAATPFAGVVFGGHTALALVKLNAKAPYAQYLVYDPFGAASY
ncbi:4Fe-4S binding protein, partial [bacterium]